MYIVITLFIILVVGWFIWGMYLLFVPKRYRVITDGKEIRIRFPYGTIGCANYKSVEKAKEQIAKYIQEHLQAEKDKKKKWKVVK